MRIKIDITGGMGTGPLALLKNDGYTVIGVNSSESPNDKEQFRNVRSELWFDLRGRARDKRIDLSRIPQEIRDKLIRELAAPKYSIRGGYKVVEDKGEMKARLGYSPDLADGLNLAFYEPPSRKVTVSSMWD